MRCAVVEESFASLNSLWVSGSDLRWSHIFCLPPWMQVWWQEFGSGREPYMLSTKDGEDVIGVAPLLLKDGTAEFLGSINVCDYLDFVIAPGREEVFFETLLGHLKEKGVQRLELALVRPDSTVMTHLLSLAGEMGHGVSSRQEDVSVEMELPATWEEYLDRLPGKERHEIRRKLRRLNAEGNVQHRLISDPALISQGMGIFFQMFTESRRDKADFLTTEMESYFRSLSITMADAGLARLGVLELDDTPTAIIMYFDYGDRIYLYNSGYEPRYDGLSVGLICKALCIQNSIEEGKKTFDFLKGNESYKYRLGGKEVPLYRCEIAIH